MSKSATLSPISSMATRPVIPIKYLFRQIISVLLISMYNDKHHGLKRQISNLVRRTRLWNNLPHERSKSNRWKAILVKSICGYDNQNEPKQDSKMWTMLSTMLIFDDTLFRVKGWIEYKISNSPTHN